MSRDIRVLVVDDSEFFGTLVAGELASLYDMAVEPVTDASDALDRLAAEPFDCVVSDYDMPGMDGIELFDRLREHGIDLPFILLTAAGSEAVASEAITAGVTDYFPKTAGDDQFEILGQRIRNVVSQHRAERQLQRQRQLHEDLWQITHDLVSAPAQGEIDRQVCRRLVEIDRFAFAWISDGDPAARARTVAGLERAALQRVRDALDPETDREPTVAAMGDWTTHTATVDAPSGIGTDTVEVVRVPLVYRDSRYGVLGLALQDGAGLGEGERDALERLGATVGHALAAVETEREVETFREAVDQADLAVVITDTDGTVEYVNRAFEEITGYGADEATGNALAEVVTGEWDDGRFASVRERVRGGQPVREEVVQYRKDGTQFHADISVAPITLGGDVEKFVAIESDITDLRSHEQRLQVLNRILRHNLRNDVNVVEGHLSLLLDAVDDPEARSRVEKAQEKLGQLLSLGEKVRTVDRTIRTVREEDTQGPVGLRALLAAEVEGVRETYPDATVEIDAAAGLEIPTAHIDVAVHELLVNAIEHNDSPDPRVAVHTDREAAPDGFVAVEIVDNGPGIPDVERGVLERGEETKLEHGRSLGLWLVNWVVTYTGGDLEIEDASDGGSVVRLVLPLSE